MLKTVLLLDGSEAMNSSEDYQPNYLLAIRPPLLQFVRRYLQGTTLASLGVVVMRDGVASLLHTCTTNVHDLQETLEADYFLYGGSGGTSLENGLRAALAEILDDPQEICRAASSSSSLLDVHSKKMRINNTNNNSILTSHHGTGTSGVQQGGRDAATAHRNNSKAIIAQQADAVPVEATQRQIILVSASVTVIDPTDIYRTIRLLTRCKVRVHVVSILGAVHVFQECAAKTHGTLYCPLHYSHLLGIFNKMAVGYIYNNSNNNERDRRLCCAMIPIGFPMRRRLASLKARSGGAAVKKEKSGISSSANALASSSSGADTADVLVCPVCEEPQTSMPSTCRRCRLRLSSIPFIYSMFISRNALVAPSIIASNTAGRKDRKRSRGESPGDVAEQQYSAPATLLCGLCHFNVSAVVWCAACRVPRCEDCNKYVRESLQLCPSCIAL